MSKFPSLFDLNQAQAAVVTAPAGHLCVNAAAGTGKTRTIAARILYLQLEEDVPAEAIMALSFSRAARASLLSHVEAGLARIGRGGTVRVLTLHGLAYRIIRLAAKQRKTWLRPGFTLLEHRRGQTHPLFAAQGKHLVGDLRDSYSLSTRLELYPIALHHVRQGHPDLDRAVLSPQELPEEGQIEVPWAIGSHLTVDLADLRRVWIRYQKLLRAQNCIDYAGLLTEAVGLLYEEEETLLPQVQQDLQYLFVDEYQDTSQIQSELIQLLAGDQVSVCVVGDAYQTIYGFQGARSQNLSDFASQMQEKPLPVLPVIHLRENYRSSPHILVVANRFLAQIDAHLDHPLRPAIDRDLLPNLPVMRVRAANREQAGEWIAGEISRLIKEEGVSPGEIAVLVRKDSEHSPQGGAVRDALQRLGLHAHLQVRSDDRTALIQAALEQYLNQADQYGATLDEILSRLAAPGQPVDLGQATRQEARAMLSEAQRAGAQFGYEAIDYIYDMAAPEQSEPDNSAVHVRTIHSAKGLEFRVVFVTFVGDREFPSGSRFDLEEERRLYYVALTRAMERLYVVGQPGTESDSFFDLIAGEGVQLQEARPPQAAPGAVAGDPFDDAFRQQVSAARTRQEQLTAQNRRNRTWPSDHP